MKKSTLKMFSAMFFHCLLLKNTFATHIPKNLNNIMNLTTSPLKTGMIPNTHPCILGPTKRFFLTTAT